MKFTPQSPRFKLSQDLLLQQIMPEQENFNLSYLEGTCLGISLSLVQAHMCQHSVPSVEILVQGPWEFVVLYGLSDGPLIL